MAEIKPYQEASIYNLLYVAKRPLQPQRSLFDLNKINLLIRTINL